MRLVDLLPEERCLAILRAWLLEGEDIPDYEAMGDEELQQSMQELGLKKKSRPSMIKKLCAIWDAQHGKASGKLVSSSYTTYCHS